jgi:hypothetical protein
MLLQFPLPPIYLVGVSGRKHIVSEVLPLVLLSLLVLNDSHLLDLYSGLCFG